MTKLEQVLNRVQRELGGQVGSFRLKGIRHRFTGRSSLVAFADGMWGGEFALKFFSDPEAAQTEFNIYRQATVRPPPLHPLPGVPLHQTRLCAALRSRALVGEQVCLARV